MKVPVLAPSKVILFIPLALAYTGGAAGYDVVGCKNEKSEVLYMNPFIASKGKVKTGIWTLFVGSIWEELYNKHCK